MNTPEKCATAADIKIVSTEVLEKGGVTTLPIQPYYIRK